ncbi:kanadaptin isoform X4 [Odontomachus brunneus]|uniref:kanadaptin isoform X4 n=1 Tax=Odontomachus brunneus TaxID=486640 RepID=UPI0013F1B6E4|nr:kanadaptin isoform X4 [Odontomachus brunneus]
MEVDEQKNESMTSSENNSVIGDNLNTSGNEVISESLSCDERNIEESKTKDTFDDSKNGSNNTCEKPIAGFKKPFSLIIGPKRGKIGKIRRMTNDVSSVSSVPLTASLLANEETTETIQPKDDALKIDKSISKNTPEENVTSDTKDIPVPYTEPSWGGKPMEEYKLEVLKSGVILETINLTESFYVVGRLPSCHLSLAHPTISRYHAIIQYRAIEDTSETSKDIQLDTNQKTTTKNSKGFYLYDLESTHGTFWNSHRIKPRTYVRLHGGHMIKFGCSQRKYILQAPAEDQEDESELTVTELKEKRLDKIREKQELEIRLQEEEKAKEKSREAEESGGIDWGMGEDADEETDLTENPYATMTEEELYLDDPKKTLRGWFEREGYDLQYQVEEKRIGQFLCWVDLPKECFGGRSMKAEALVKGKKKEAVIQSALEACRILDRHGLLRQANHESRKRKARNWEEEDYYDSDEDNFLDRTGTVERKREQRMKQAGKLEEKVETYNTLIEKHNEIVNKISHLTNRLKEAQANSAKEKESNEDSLDAFMSSLTSFTLSKSDITKMKVELQNLRKEEEKLIKLINLAKPANLPPLVSQAPTGDKKYQTYQRSKLFMKKSSQLERRRKLFQNNSETAVSSNNTLDNEEEEDNVQEEGNKVRDIEDVGESKCKKSVPFKDPEEKTQNNTKSIIESINTSSTLLSQNMERSKPSVGDNKKQKDRKSEKSKGIKKHYDQDVHSDDYSTWLPPQDQTGDGRTSLNDKYGY